MRFLLRVAVVAVAGVALYEAGMVNAATQLRPSPAGAIFTAVALAVALALLCLAVAGTGENDDAAGPSVPPTVMRAAFVFISAMSLVGLAWLRGIPYPPLHDPTTYHNDAIALNECAAQQLMQGKDPYRDLDLLACYDARLLGPDRTTPLRRGAFADVEIYPTEERMDAAWAAAKEQLAGEPGQPDEFVWRLSYPALAVLLIVPWVALGWDVDVVYALCLIAAMLLVLARAPARARGFILTGLLAAISLTAFTVGGSADLLYALPLVAAWLWRERRWSAVALGVSASVKQLAWPFAVFYLLQVAAHDGWREAVRRTGLAAAVFAIANVPFLAWDAPSWWLGILTPIAEPMFPRGAGLVTLSTNGALPLLPTTAYLALEVLAAAACLAVAWRTRRSSPELGLMLAMVPLYFAWRSLFSYFFLLPLFAFVAIARMPLGHLSAEAARAAGAVTVLAMPSREASPRGS